MGRAVSAWGIGPGARRLNGGAYSDAGRIECGKSHIGEDGRRGGSPQGRGPRRYGFAAFVSPGTTSTAGGEAGVAATAGAAGAGAWLYPPTAHGLEMANGRTARFRAAAGPGTISFPRGAAEHAHGRQTYYAIHTIMIRSFRDKATALVHSGGQPRGMSRDLAVAARRKLAALDAAQRLEDLRIPPGNRLEALKGDLAGAHSIRINGQWRLVFVWREDGPHEVEIVDYH